MRSTIDVNCDLGEDTGIEMAVMPYISSANIACGAHAGNQDSIQSTIRLAKAQQVVIGAHPSYPDRKHFGRVVMPIDLPTLMNSVTEQIKRVSDIANQEQYPLGHIKLHGALYNEAAKNKLLAEAMVKIVIALNPLWVLYGPPGSELKNAALRYGLSYCSEGFPDRTYQDDGSLTPRSDPQALITEEKKYLEQALQMIHLQQVTTRSGKIISLPNDTLCLHGDGPHALPFAKALQSQLKKENINIQPAYARIS